MANGYWGKLIEVDMTTGTVNVTDRHMQYVKDFVGGRGIGMKMLWEALKDNPGADAMGPENPLIILGGVCTGVPLVGGASRYCICTKSPVTMAKNSPFGELGATVSHSMSGGQFGPKLRWAGYDGVYVTGVSDTPKVLVIDNDEIKLDDATKYWGMTVPEFEEAAQKDYGSRFNCIGIGPAAENGVRYGCVINEIGRAAGRGGTGTVMASKKLKGIICYGDQVVPIAHPEKLQEAMEKYDQMGWIDTNTPPRRLWGTAATIENNNDSSTKVVKNFKEAYNPNTYNIGAVAAEREYWVKHRSCAGCMVRCMKAGIVKSGPFQGKIAEGPEYESAMNGDNWLVKNMTDFGGLMEIIDAMGFDMVTLGGVVGMALEAYEKGAITAADLGGIKLEWGNAEEIHKFITEIVYNKDKEIFEWFRRGPQYAANKIGKDTIQYTMAVKNHSFAAWHPTTIGKARCISYGLSNRGACHVSGTSAATQNSICVRDMGVFCTFSGGAYGTTGMVDIINFIMGTQLSSEQAVYIGEKIWNLEKVFNVCNGFRREDDALPWRTHNDPITVGPKAGTVFPKEEYEAILDEFYTERGWDVATSIPTEGKLNELGLDDMIPYMKKYI